MLLWGGRNSRCQGSGLPEKPPAVQEYRPLTALMETVESLPDYRISNVFALRRKEAPSHGLAMMIP